MFSRGSDCCGTCEFNTANREQDASIGWQDRTFICEIRQQAIDAPFWTYCHNHQRRNPLLSQRPRGPIWAAVTSNLRSVPFSEHLYLPPEVRLPRDVVGWTRAPYYEGLRPRDSGRGACEICGDQIEHTLALELGPADKRCFCSVAHYMEWWFQMAAEASPYRDRHPVSPVALRNDLQVLAAEIAKLDSQPLLSLDETRLMDVLGGLEGALIQSGHGYLDLAQIAIYLGQPSVYPELSPRLLRILSKMGEIGQRMHEEIRNVRHIRAALHEIHELLDAYLVSELLEGPGGPMRKRRRK